MASNDIEIVPNAPIIIATIEPSASLDEAPERIQRLVGVLDAQTTPVYLVLDLMGMKLKLDELLIAATQAARGTGAFLHHPKIIETLVIIPGTDTFLRQAMAGMRSATFGFVRTRAFETIDQALEYCHERIAETTQK